MKSLIQAVVWALVPTSYAVPLTTQVEKRQVESQLNDSKPTSVDAFVFPFFPS